MKLKLAGVQDSLEYPAGRYRLALVDGEVRATGEDTKHPENPFWNCEFQIQDGRFEGKPMFTNFMLPPYEIFNLKNFLRATGQLTDEELEAEELDVVLTEDDEDYEEDSFVLLQDPPLEVIGVVGKNKKSGNLEIRKFERYDEEDWVPADDDDVLP